MGRIYRHGVDISRLFAGEQRRARGRLARVERPSPDGVSASTFGRSTVSVSTLPLSSLAMTKTPSRLSSSMSSLSRGAPSRMLPAAFSALCLVVFSTFDSRAPRSKKKSATPRIGSIAPIARAMNSVRRHRMDTCSGLLQDVSDPAHRAYEVHLARGVHLFPEVGDVDVDQVGRQAELLVPHPREEELAGEHPTRVSGHELEQLVLAGCQFYLSVGATHLAGGGVDLEVRYAQHLVPFRPPQERTDAGQKLLDVERLGEVVVCAEVEAVDLVERGVAGG